MVLSFIRYKINKTDYTQWYSIGYPIYVDVINRNNIVRYIFNRDAFPEKKGETIEIDQLTNLIIAFHYLLRNAVALWPVSGSF